MVFIDLIHGSSNKSEKIVLYVRKTFFYARPDQFEKEISVSSTTPFSFPEPFSHLLAGGALAWDSC